MADDVITKTEQLIAKLRELSKEAGTSETYLNNLEGIITQLGSLNLGNMEKSVEILAQFNRNLMLMTGNVDSIKQVQTAFSELGLQIEYVNSESARRGAVSTESAITRKGFRKTAEDRVAYDEAKKQAQDIQKIINERNAIWEKNLQLAEMGIKLQQRTLEKLSVSNVQRSYKNPPLGQEKNPNEYAKGEPIPISQESLRNVGLSSIAAKNLNDRLKELGITSATVSQPITELSTGITTVTVTAEAAGGGIQRFTAHMSRAGMILQDTQKRFRDFGSAIMRDVVEVMKWTIAISAIYAPMRKMSEMLEQAKQIQLAMVDVQIVLGGNTQKLNEAFQAAAEVATQTSSELVGVIQGYSLAAAAASGASNQMEKMVTTESLLKNSMILSKLANTDQKTALDTLVGALSQAGLKLTEGSKLLDSWVAVSKQANVSVSQMADTFSIVGSAAQEVGLSLDQINALVGALGQSTNLSGQEIGNAIRGIIAAIQTDKAATEFAKYGIATKSLNGDMRDFLELLREIKVMQDQGLLNEKQMGALMQAGGAGARRGAQLSALVQSLDKVMNLVAVSENASGDAEKAMALEMDTLDAATKRLSNSFAELANSLGGEGGVLNFLTLVTQGTTGLVKGIRDLVGVMKWAAPVFATFMIAKGIAGTPTGANILGNLIPMGLRNVLTPEELSGTSTANPIMKWLKSKNLGLQKVGSIDYTNMAGMKVSTPEYATATWATMFTGIKNMMMQPFFPQQNLYQTPNYGREWYEYGSQQGQLASGLQFAIPNIFKNINFASLLGPAIIASTNIGRENGGQRALAGGIGALPGILAGNPIWATIGSIIATGFYDKFLTLEPDMAQKWLSFATENPQVPQVEGQPVTWMEQLNANIKEMLTGVKPTQIPPEKAPEKTLDEVLKGLDDTLIKNMSAVDKLNVNIFQKQPMWALPKEFQTKEFGALKENQAMALLTIYAAQKQGMTPEGVKFGERTITGMAAKPYLSEETMKMIDDYLNIYALKAIENGTKITPIETERGAQVKAINDLVTKASADLMNKAITDLASGAGNISNIENAQTVTNTLAESVGTLMTAQKYTPGMAPIIPEQAINVVSQLSPEEATKLNTAASDIVSGLSQLSDVQSKINAARAQGIAVSQEYLDQEKKLNEQVANARQLLPQLYNALKQVTLARQAETQMKPVLEIPEGVTEDQLQKAILEADRMWKEYLKSQNIPQDQLDAWIAQQQQQILMAKDKVFSTTTNVPQKFLNLAFQQQGLGGTVGITDWRDKLTMSSLSTLMASYKQVAPMFQKLGYTLNEDDNIVVTKDGFQRLHFDNTIMQLLMNTLIDETKKQGLQGIYNLPEGATFMVPVSAYELDRATRSETAGGGFNMAGMADIMKMLQDALLGVGEDWKYKLSETKVESPVMAPTAQDIANMRATGNYEWPPKTVSTTATTPEVTNPILGYSTGNPLPVMVTNLLPNGTLGNYDVAVGQANQKIPNGTIGNYDVYAQTQGAAPTIESPEARVRREYDVGNQAPNLQFPSILNEDKMFNFFKTLDSWTRTPSMVPPTTSFVPPAENMEGVNKSTVTTALNLDMKSTVILTVDGRTLATIIKPFFYEDLIRYMSSANSTINRSVIG